MGIPCGGHAVLGRRLRGDEGNIERPPGTGDRNPHLESANQGVGSVRVVAILDANPVGSPLEDGERVSPGAGGPDGGGVHFLPLAVDEAEERETGGNSGTVGRIEDPVVIGVVENRSGNIEDRCPGRRELAVILREERPKNLN